MSTSSLAGVGFGSDPGSGAGSPSAAGPGSGCEIRLHDVVLGYRRRAVLGGVDGVDLVVSAGEILTVVGPSGCGKSTLLRGLAGLLPTLRGRISVGGVPVTGPGSDRAMVFQDDALLPWLDVRRNIEFPLAVRQVPRAERKARAEEWITRVGLDGFDRHLPGRLSGGMRQRVQLARALIGAPPVVLMDEPFGALDPATRAAMRALLVDVWRQGGPTVVFVTHDVDEALEIGDRVIVLGRAGIDTVIPVQRPRDATASREGQRARVLTALMNSAGAPAMPVVAADAEDLTAAAATAATATNPTEVAS
ncbi:ABC transporter related [Catenulispora acidiphila DSM 44928]|uniref:ABC transporter related n=1 Tax=Catenulispora acidiphila (strain DSM 44928 / JCM 14897 / NBRC 102108 / NRRL B-24433 / ID139908) TaxID=479433 RepID=C7QD95_CATAD|nr:ABC transporter ATP-binding protein [Catenulispora acidiphila]ACU72688.1 ABC transporter related [Catenulispora acidiphila DSM 44928]